MVPKTNKIGFFAVMKSVLKSWQWRISSGTTALSGGLLLPPVLSLALDLTIPHIRIVVKVIDVDLRGLERSIRDALCGLSRAL